MHMRTNPYIKHRHSHPREEGSSAHQVNANKATARERSFPCPRAPLSQPPLPPPRRTGLITLRRLCFFRPWSLPSPSCALHCIETAVISSPAPLGARSVFAIPSHSCITFPPIMPFALLLLLSFSTAVS
ncbi:hypothetical protein Naga_101657g2 [Nannochloropsis gaditana]|uniref:Uncharacterized protein n=1 Tax=Nannochloropsis gaditana TaxID=72520 RepID=W7T158_9STRA|nr:hypothetical protein Naga_101657g2 [Nannochloropsis gaditana]